MKKYTLEDLKNVKPEDIETEEAGPRTPVLALLQLTIVQTYLLEMIKAEGHPGSASQAFEHVQKAMDALNEYEIPQEH